MNSEFADLSETFFANGGDDVQDTLSLLDEVGVAIGWRRPSALVVGVWHFVLCEKKTISL